jgi:Skp family chaperone for outer membrane proteins
MEYILQNVPDYTEAKNALEQKAQAWKQEISTKTAIIDKLKESLKTERVLLTRELIEEREEEINFQENELRTYQQKRFGPSGDLMVQKAVLVKPIQDQVFTAVQDIAEQKRFDFVFDKSSDLTIIFAAKQFDISDIVVRKLTRTSKRSQLSKSELKAEAIKEYKEDVEDANSDFAIRKKILEDKKAARDSLISSRKADRDKILADRKAVADTKRADAAAKRAEAVAKRQEILDKRNGVAPKSSPAEKPAENTTEPKENLEKPSTTDESPKVSDKETQRQEIIAVKKKEMDDRRKALADKKAKTIKDREDAIKAKEAESLPKP